jgi:hypothetical protein
VDTLAACGVGVQGWVRERHCPWMALSMHAVGWSLYNQVLSSRPSLQLSNSRGFPNTDRFVWRIWLASFPLLRLTFGNGKPARLPSSSGLLSKLFASYSCGGGFRKVKSRPLTSRQQRDGQRRNGQWDDGQQRPSVNMSLDHYRNY